MNAEVTTDPATGKDTWTATGLDNNQTVEMGKYYGSIEDGTMRVVYNPATSHQWQFFSAKNSTITNQFFMDTLGAPNAIDAGNQLWFVKELFSALGIVGFFLFLLPFAYILMTTKFFGTLLEPVPAARLKPDDGRGKAVSTIGRIILAVVPGLTVMPLFSKVAYTWIFGNGATNNTTKFFLQPGPNAIIVWAVFNGLVMLAVFFLQYLLYGKKRGDNIDNWGVKTSWSNVGKAFLLAALVAAVAYSFVLLARKFMLVDFRFWSFAIRGAGKTALSLVWRYLPFMLFFWLCTSFSVNAGGRVATDKKWKNTALCVFINVIGLIALVAIQFIVLFSTGVAAWYQNRAWVNICLVIPFIPMMFIGTIILRKAFRKTGTIYFGAFLMAIISTIIMVANANTILSMS